VQKGMNRFEIAGALQEIGLLLKLMGKDQFRSRAYLRAAQAVASVDGDFDDLVRNKRLVEIKGIGGSLAGVIEDLFATGHSSVLDKLRSELPPGVLELSKIPGLTLKRIRELNEALGITSVAELKAALEAGALRDVSGFGVKFEEALRAALSQKTDGEARILLVNAMKIGEQVIEYMRAFDGLVSIDLAGSMRRWKETVSLIRITAGVSKSPQLALKHFLQFPPITEVVSQTRNRATVMLIDGVRVSFSVASSAEYWSLLHYETGSADHLSALQEIAKQKGLQITTNRLTKARRSLSVDSEEYIYRQLGMQYVPPELREGQGEIEDALAGRIPKDLIEIKNIKGMIHCHTTYSDGRNSVEEMAVAAEAMGMKYLTISDHSPTAHYAGGVTVDRLKRQWDEISRVQERVSIKLLRATESDILRDGGLDYPDNILEKFDLIIASIHNRYKLDNDQMTKRVVNALKNPLFKVWGHPLGRLLLRRPPIECRMEEILDIAAQSASAIEISGHPNRLDLEPRWIREARKRGIKFVISTDAHSVHELQNLKFGIGIARRGGVVRGEVLNTLRFDSFRSAVRPIS